MDMYKEVNTGTNLPAQIDIYSTPSDRYEFLFIAKGGGSANKTFLYQQTKALLKPDKLYSFLDEKIKVNFTIQSLVNVHKVQDNSNLITCFAELKSNDRLEIRIIN